MKVLFIGDIVGKPGRELVRKSLRALVDHHSIDLVVANAENVAAGFGITKDIGDALLDWGVDGIMTDRPDILARVLGADERQLARVGADGA